MGPLLQSLRPMSTRAPPEIAVTNQQRPLARIQMQHILLNWAKHTIALPELRHPGTFSMPADASQTPTLGDVRTICGSARLRKMPCTIASNDLRSLLCLLRSWLTLNFVQRLRQICNDVMNIFNAYGHA